MFDVKIRVGSAVRKYTTVGGMRLVRSLPEKRLKRDSPQKTGVL